MSTRHEFPSKQAGHTVAIGWDNPMQTFFGEVTREQDDEDERDPTVLWLGVRFGEVPTPDAMTKPLAPWFDLTPEHLAQLAADRAADGGLGPTKLQRIMGGFMADNS